ncbi:MAG: helix-hairpin-helix domain-containing protein [Candidatus Omnitrophica bacterium]|nr:helix-hairpin-helix domain-containing protein [Candidatus Omnitrophota bacterium]MBU1869810.1 helix-hairpin-helix domain-containing protein [Candidatus Omnitrophota bacterium]
MFSLTKDERRVILFLTCVVMSGMGIDFAAKTFPPVKRIVCVQAGLVKIDINQATLEDLLSTRCITKKLAQSILEYRVLNGPFRELEQLKEVKGVKDKRYEKLKEVLYLK